MRLQIYIKIFNKEERISSLKYNHIIINGLGFENSPWEKHHRGTLYAKAFRRSDIFVFIQSYVRKVNHMAS